MRTGRQAALTAFDKPLQIIQVDLRDPQPDELLVRVLVSGVCGSDVHTSLGEIPRNLPIVLGHEGIGVVERLGANVVCDYAGRPLEEGDRIYWSPAKACARCRACTPSPDLAACESIAVYTGAGQLNANTYADWAMLSAGMGFFKLPGTLPSDALIAFGCALPTMLQARERLGGIRSDERVIIQGCGPVGLAATLLCKLAGCTDIIAYDHSAERRTLALGFGARRVSAPPADEEIKDLSSSNFSGRGASLIVEASGSIQAFSQGLGMLGREGRYLLVGLWAGAGSEQIDPHLVVRNSWKLIGSVYAEPKHYGQAVALVDDEHANWPLAAAVRSSFQLEDVQAALDAVRTRSPGKTVLRMA